VISKLTRRILSGELAFLWLCWSLSPRSRGQVRGVYPVGMSATNSGVTPRSGFTIQISCQSIREMSLEASGKILAIV
jgi:hypothetical protein